VRRGRNVQRAHHHVHTTIELAPVDRATIDGLPAMTPARTLIDLARFVGPKQLTAAVDSALRDRLTSELHLHRRIVALRSRGRYGIPKLLAVIEGTEASRGGHSWLERRFLELCASAGLPRPTTQQVMTRTNGHLVRVDCHFPGTCVVVELLGYRWHRTRAQLTNDAARLNALVLDGLTPLQFTYDHVTCSEQQVIAELRAALVVAAEPTHGYAGKVAQSAAISSRIAARASGDSWSWSARAMNDAICAICGSSMPCVVTAGVPRRSPLVTNGLRGSLGTVFLFVVMPA
jgi:very-short-patch-repair endonuclease